MHEKNEPVRGRKEAAIVGRGQNDIIGKKIWLMWRKVGGGKREKEWWSMETLTRTWASDKRESKPREAGQCLWSREGEAVGGVGCGTGQHRREWSAGSKFVCGRRGRLWQRGRQK